MVPTYASFNQGQSYIFLLIFSLVLGLLPTFQPTSLPELDELLEKFRSNVFFPAHLPKAQREIIYRPKYHHLLMGDEPATVTIGNEIVQMHPLNPMRDEPKMSTSFGRINKLMREAKNYQNLVPFMIGCRTSKRVLRKSFVEKAVRHACEQKNENVIMECLRQTDQTGLKLWHHNIAETLMFRAIWMALDMDWTEEAVDKGLRFADMLWIMMQHPKHTEAGLPNPAYNPVIVGVMVQLHAAKAVKSLGQIDAHGKVIEYTQRLLALWDKLIFPVSYDEFDAHSNLRKWAPIWHGMKMARKVSGVTREMREELGIRVKEIASALENARKFLQLNPRPASFQLNEKLHYDQRGLNLYEKLSSVVS